MCLLLDVGTNLLARAVGSVLGCTCNDSEVEQLLSNLDEACLSMHAAHRALTASWEQPLSLFGAQDEVDAEKRGVARWALDAVKQGSCLVDQVAELEYLSDIYRKQLVEYQCIRRNPVQELTRQVDAHAHRLTTHVPMMILARETFKNTSSVSPSLSVLSLCYSLANSTVDAQSSRRSPKPLTTKRRLPISITETSLALANIQAVRDCYSR